MHGIWILSITAFKRGQHVMLGLSDLRGVNGACRGLGGKRCSSKPGPASEHHQVRERVAAQAIRAMQSGSGFTGGEQARQ